MNLTGVPIVPIIEMFPDHMSWMSNLLVVDLLYLDMALTADLLHIDYAVGLLHIELIIMWNIQVVEPPPYNIILTVDPLHVELNIILSTNIGDLLLVPEVEALQKELINIIWNIYTTGHLCLHNRL